MTDTPQNRDAPSSGPKKYRLDDPNNADKIYWLLITICAVLFVADLFYHKHPYFEVEGGFGFYGWFGFIACVGLVFVARQMRKLFKRNENYYDENRNLGGGDS